MSLVTGKGDSVLMSGENKLAFTVKINKYFIRQLEDKFTGDLKIPFFF